MEWTAKAVNPTCPNCRGVLKSQVLPTRAPVTYYSPTEFILLHVAVSAARIRDAMVLRDRLQAAMGAEWLTQNPSFMHEIVHALSDERMTDEQQQHRLDDLRAQDVPIPGHMIQEVVERLIRRRAREEATEAELREIFQALTARSSMAPSTPRSESISDDSGLSSRTVRRWFDAR